VVEAISNTGGALFESDQGLDAAALFDGTNAIPVLVDASVVVDPSPTPAEVGEIIDLRPRESAPGRHRRRGLLAATPWQLLVKRAFDVVLGSALLVLLTPLMVLIAAGVRLSSRGSALYAQERIGRDGRAFRMFKFRSMRVGAHEERVCLMKLNEADGPLFKIRDDPRTTRIGRLIRKLSMDELPQLLNVLRGEMSLVGPRPPLPEEYAAYGPRERRRMAVTPGITGAWQIGGRSDIDYRTAIELDLEYIDRWTLRSDLVVLVRTIPAVVSGRGAY
jgi:lipopolysaccharide/colanic/teichoic acid biosynthesis glycosyltransferase